MTTKKLKHAKTEKVEDVEAANKLKKEMGSLQKVLNDEKQKNQTLNDEIKALNEASKSLNAMQNEKNEKINQLKEKLKVTDQTNKQNELVIDELNGLRESLEQNLGQVEKEKSKFEKDLEARSQEVTNLKKDCAQKDEIIFNAEKQLKVIFFSFLPEMLVNKNLFSAFEKNTQLPRNAVAIACLIYI